jgi:arabinofuranan 3-O-arabinosyltransferase
MGLSLQTWFKVGTSIASGDITPPIGTAWIGRIFEPWVWTGSNLGETSQLVQDLPFAVVITVVHVLGGDADAAQRVWYTALYVGAALSAVGLIAALGMRPLAGLVGASIYVLNPYVVSLVNTYPPYAAALCLLPAIPAILIGIGRTKLSLRWGALAIAPGAPLLGTAFSNPPLIGMILGIALVVPLLVLWTHGRDVAFRTVRASCVLLPLLFALSAFWLLPAIIHLSDSPAPQLASISSWAWTEGRATIRNAFWLNPVWSWKFPEYFPYAGLYDRFPIGFAKFALPAIAFGALALSDRSGDGKQLLLRDRALRVALVSSSAALFTIFISTGTRPPGNAIFDRLYQLPFGWLLREPGRFLMVAGLAYALLGAVVVEAVLNGRSMLELLRRRTKYSTLASAACVPALLATSLLVGFPLWTGSVVPDHRPKLPSAHVKVPDYWPTMARLTDSLAVQGAVLVMPPDDYYQMPYDWGYYGSDNFVVEMFNRRVLLPNDQGYLPTSPELISAVSLTTQSILDHDWPRTKALVKALNTPLILVRHDVDDAYPGRSIISSNRLSEALATSPDFELVQRIGSLELFALTSPTPQTEVDGLMATVNTTTPDLRLLSFFPQSANLVSTTPQAGVASAAEAPMLETWNVNGNTLEWSFASPKGWSYRLVDLKANAAVSLDHPGTFLGPGGTTVTYGSDSTRGVAVSIPAREVIANGDFGQGSWGPVSDCNTANPIAAAPSLDGRVVPGIAPGGLPALRLAASIDSACVSQSLSWNRGALVLSMQVRHADGSAPRICLWEVGPSRCAPAPDLPTGPAWSWYRASVTPDVGTTSIILYLYADGGAPRRTVNEYANVSVVEVSSLPRVALLGNPLSFVRPPVRLVLLHTSYSDLWQGSVGKHVIVDGLLNGWLVPPQSTSFAANYSPEGVIDGARWVSVAVLLAILIVVLWPWESRLAKRQRRFLVRHIWRH